MDYNRTRRQDNDPAEKVKRKVVLLLPIGVALIVIAVLLLTVDFIQIVANYKSQVKNGSEVHQILTQETSGLYVSAYLFNVTNAEQFLSGEDHKLKLEEVGPFTYLEVRNNLELEIDDEAQLARYSPRYRLEFLPEKSVADPRDVNVTMPNVAMLTMSSMISSHSYLERLGFSLLLNSLRSQVLVQLSAHDFLWGHDEPLIRLGNTLLPGWISFETLGIMDRMYDDKVEYRLEVGTALEEKFKVKTMNGLGGLRVWDYEEPSKRTRCNTFTDAYEGIAYPNQLFPGAPLRLFRNTLCRFLNLDYHGQVTTEQGAKAYHYKIGRSNFEINNDTECLCGKGTCISGISDLSPCYYRLPLALSNAHFLHGDPKLFERLEGLNPDEEKHGSEILVESKIGMVLKTHFSVQVNLVVSKIDFNAQAERFSDMVVPVCYFKLEQPELTEANRHSLNLMYLLVPNILLGLEIVFFLTGAVLLAYCLQLLLPRIAYFKSRGISFRNTGDQKPLPNAVPLLRINRVPT